MNSLRGAVRWWAVGWSKFVEASRGPIVDRLVGPNPWGETLRATKSGRSHA